MGLQGFSHDELFSEETPGSNLAEQRKREEEQRRKREEQTRRKNEERMLLPRKKEDLGELGFSHEELLEDVPTSWEMESYRRFQEAKQQDEERAAYEAKRPETPGEITAGIGKRAYYGAQKSVDAVSQALGNIGFWGLDTMHTVGLISDEDYEEAKADPDTYRDKFNEVAENAPWWNPIQRIAGFLATDSKEHEKLEQGRRYWQDKEDDVPISLGSAQLEQDEDWTKKLKNPLWLAERMGPEALKMGVALAASGGNPTIGAGVIAGSHYGDAKKSAEDFFQEHRPDMDPTERMIASDGLAAATTAIEFLSEKVLSVPTVLKAMRGVKGGGVIPQTAVVNRMADFLTRTRMGRATLKAAVTGEDVLDNLWGVRVGMQAARAGAYGLKAGAAEGTEEVISGNSQRLLEYILGDPKAFDSGWQESVTEFVGGAAVGGPIAVGPAFINAGPQHRVERRRKFAEAVDQVAQTPGGIQALRQLAKKESPSRRDFIEAGVDPAAIGNIKEREEIAKLFTDEAMQKYSQEARKRQDLQEGLERGRTDAAAIQQQLQDIRQTEEYQQATEGMTPEQIRDFEMNEAWRFQEQRADVPAADVADSKQRMQAQQINEQAKVATQIAQREKGQLAGPEYVKKRMEEKKRLATEIHKAFPNIDPGMAIASAEVLQNWMTVEETSALTFTRGGNPKDTALYQIQEVVERILKVPVSERGGQSEGLFFGREGTFRQASKAQLESRPDLKASRTVVETPVDETWANNVDAARAEAARKQKGLRPDEVAYKEPKDPYPYGDTFDQNHYDQEGSRAVLNEALDDFVAFTEENPEYEQYYETEVAKERDILTQKYPELAEDNNFWFYRMINAVASAQTELSQNTEETDMAYGGFRETGSIPVVMSEKEVETAKGMTTKADPKYALPRKDDSTFPVVTYEDVERIIANLKPIVDRVGKKDAITVPVLDKDGNQVKTKGGKVKTTSVPTIPRKAINALLKVGTNPSARQQFIMNGPTKKKKGQPAQTYKDFLYEYFAPTFIQTIDTKAVGTSSKPLVTKLLREYLTALQNNGGDHNLAAAAMRDKVRTAFTIYGGSSQYNKARNYATMNLLFNGNEQTAAAGIPKFRDADGNPNVKGLVDWLNDRITWDEFKKTKIALGFGDPQSDKSAILDTVWTAEGQQDTIPRTFLFGPKVGAYMLNRMADYDARNADYNTMDVWESRFWRGLVGDQLLDDAPGIASGMPRKVYMRLARDFAKLYKERTGKDLKVSAGQAARWYMMKRAASEAGYARAGEDETIAGFTSRVMDKWIAWQLNQQVTMPSEPQTPMELLEDALTQQEDLGVPVTVTQVGDVEVFETGMPVIDQVLGQMSREEAQRIVGDPASVQVLFQKRAGKIAGSTEMGEGMEVVIRAFENADEDTLLEELSHGLRLMALRWDVPADSRGITDEELQALEDWAHGGPRTLLGQEIGGRREQWTREADENFAAGMRQILTEEDLGAEVPALKSAFQKIRNVLSSIYNTFVGRRPDLEIPQDIRSIFKKLQTREMRVLEARGKGIETVPVQEALGRKKVKVRDAGPAEFLAAQEGMAQSEFMDKKSSVYLKAVIENGGKVRLAPDGRSGYVISPEGDLQNLFVNKTKGDVAIAGKEMMAQAMADGARTLDVYRGHLTDFYSNMGWKVKSFTPWNEEFAPEGWNYEKYGTPDYVEMVYEGTRDPDRILKGYKTHGNPEDQFKSGNDVHDALDEYEFNGGSMTIEEFMEDAGIDAPIEDVVADIESYDGFGEAVFDPEDGTITFFPQEDKDVVQMEEEADVRPEDAPQPAVGGTEIKAAGYFQRSVRRGTATDVRARRLSAAAAQPQTRQERLAPTEVPAAGDPASAATTQAAHGRRPERGQRAQGKRAFQAEISERVRGGESKTARQLTQEMATRFGVTVHQGRLPIQNAFAVYHTGNKTIRADQREIFDLGIMSHEVAHKIDDNFGVTKSDLPPKVVAELQNLDYTQTNDLSEGFAEFVRILLTRNGPDKYAPATHEWFDQILKDKKFGDLHEKLSLTREQVAAWRNKGAVERVTDVFAGDREVDFESLYGKTDAEGNEIIAKRRLKDALSEWIIDDDKPLRRLVESARTNFKDVLRAGEPNLSDQQLEERWVAFRRRLGHDPATLHMLLRGTKAQLAERALRNGVFSVRTGKQLGKTKISDVFGLINPDEMSEFSAYAFAKAALERISLNPDYEAGVSVDDLQAVVNDIENSEKGDRYLDSALAMTRMHNEILDLMVDAGIHTPAEAAAAKGKYEFYVPMQRVKPGQSGGWNTGSDILGVGKMMKSLKNGSMRPVLDPRDSLVKRMAAAYQLANSKMVERSIIDLQKNVPGLGHLIERVPPTWEPNKGKLEDMLSQLEEGGVIDSKQVRIIRDVNNIANANFTDATLKRVAKELGVAPDEDGEFEPNDLLIAAKEAGIPDAKQIITTWAPVYSDSAGERIISTVNPNGDRELYQVSEDIWRMYSNNEPGVTHFIGRMAQDIAGNVRDKLGDRAGWLADRAVDLGRPSTAAKVFKAGATGASLAFSTKNLVMDTMFYIMKPQLDAQGNLVTMGEKLAGLGSGGQVAFQQAWSRIKEATSNDRTVEFNPTSSDVGNLYLTLGGQFHTMLGDLLIKDQEVGARFLKSGKKGVWQRTAGTLMDVVAATELPARVAAFEIQLRRSAEAGGYKIGKGGKIEGQVPMWAALEALHSAADATVNFKVGGRATRAVEMYFPFTKAAWNANRSLYQMAEIMTNNPEARAQFAVAFGTYVAAIVTLETIGQLAGWDEEEERNRWEQEGYVTFGPVKVPKVREMAFITEPIRIAVRNAIRATQGRDTDMRRALGENIGNQMKEHMPIPGLTHRSGLYGSLINAAMDWDDFKGQPIESSWMKKMDIPSRTDKQVWMPASVTANVWNAVAPQSWQLSPKKVDYIMKNTLAGHQRYISLLDTGSYKGLGRKVTEASPLAHFVQQPRLGQSWWDMKEKKQEIDQEIAGLNNQKWVSPEKTKEVEARTKELEEERKRLTYAEGLIREMQAVHYGGDQRLYEMMTGLARWVMGKPELERYPNPLGMDSEDVPEVIRQSDAWKKLKARKRMAAK